MRRIRNRGPKKKLIKNNRTEENRPQINERIPYNQLMVIDENNNRIGVISKVQALQMAEAKELDLVVVSAQGEVPVAKIVNYEKYRYEQHKKQKNNQKKQGNVKIKEVTFRPNIGIHDLEIKANKAKDWLKSGDNVKVYVYAPGRLMDRNELINAVYNKFIEFVGTNVKILKPLTRVTPTSFESLISENNNIKVEKN